MEIIRYIILGIIQGITEPIPVSSSGHIYLFKELFNTNIFNSLNFEIIANFGSFIAILIIFWKDIVDLVQNFFSYIFNKNTRKKTVNKFKYCIFLIISTIPVTITGLLFKDALENRLLSIHFLGFSFLLTALMLFIVRKHIGSKDDLDITIKDAVIIGLFQSVAILPGISRSGATLVACLLCNLKRETSLKYTFILYFPASIGSLVLGASDFISNSESSLIAPYIAGSIAALIITYFSYKWLSNWVKNGKLHYFSIYCILLALFIFIYFR